MILSTAFIREIVSSANLPTCLIETDGEIIFVNTLFEIFTGANNLSLPLHNVGEIFSFKGHPFADFVATIAAEEATRERFCSLINLFSGQMHDVVLRGIPFYSEDHKSINVMLIFNPADDIATQPADVPADDRIHKFTTDQLRLLLRSRMRELDSMRMHVENVRKIEREEMEMARNVQSAMMPTSLPEFVNMKTASTYIPAGMVGGDFYDVITMPDRRLAVLIFDVSGHGVPAALIGTVGRMLFLQSIERSFSPAEVFADVNKRMCRFMQSEHYLTAFLAFIDPADNSMIYSRAGHVRPILWSAVNGSVSQLSGRGFFIGHQAIADMAVYEDSRITLAAGDKLLLYTDGLIECHNRDMVYYGNDRLLAAVSSFGKLPLHDFQHELLEDARTFRNGTRLRDDITLLCLEAGDPADLLKDSGFAPDERPEAAIAHNIAEIPEVCAGILRRMDQNGYPDVEIKRMRICLFELMVNAIKHGNGNNPQKSVVILYHVDQKKVCLSITDEGRGFNHNGLPDPLDENNLTKDHGRGVFITRNYMNELRYNARGNSVFAVRYLGTERGI